MCYYSKMINACIVGFGNGGRHFHVPIIASTPGYKLFAVFSSNPETRQYLEVHHPETLLFTDYQEVLDHPEIHLVVITIPNHLHFDYAKMALVYGKHVVVDKPITTTFKEAETLFKLAKAKDLKICTYQNRRFDGDFLALKELIATKGKEEIYQVIIRFDRYRPEVKQETWREQNHSGAGLWYDLGPHLLDHAIELFGKPESIQPTISTQRKGAKTDDYFKVTLNYPNLEVILTAGMLVHSITPHFEVFAKNYHYQKFGLDVQEGQLKAGKTPETLTTFGISEAENAGILSETDINGVITKQIIYSKPGDYRKFYQKMAEHINNDQPAPVPERDTLQLMYLLELVANGTVDAKY